MNKNATTYTFLFALAVCVVCSFFLALASEGFRSRRENNEAFDIKQHVLKVVSDKKNENKDLGREELLRIYEDAIEGIVINIDGDIVLGDRPQGLQEEQGRYPVYLYREQGKIQAYVFPVYGKGLWSTIYGFLALENDATTIRGITFYKHGETPGLGGEVEANWFQQNFRGKKIYDIKKKRLRPVQVLKGKTKDMAMGNDVEFAVDGITGATMTSQGVSRFLDKWIRVYEPYLKRKREWVRDSGHGF